MFFISGSVVDGMENLDPYGSDLVEDYQRLIDDFGLDRFKKDRFPEPNRLMRRGVVFGGRDLERIADCIEEEKDFYALTGIMPTGDDIHFGTKMVVENLQYLQERGAETYILVADLEARAARGVTLEKGRKRALNVYIPAYIALGLDPDKTHFYFQSENRAVVREAYRFAQKVTLNEFEAVYGSADPGRIMSAVTQIADILYPQFETRRPGIVPVGVDQDPHIRLTRDVVGKMKKEGFVPPSGLYHKYMPSLDGGMKMSKSEPSSCIMLNDDPDEVCEKIRRAKTGGRQSLEEHREHGAVIEEDMVFELLKQHLVEDDDELDRIYEQYSSGALLSGEVKDLACEKMRSFLEGFGERLEEAQQLVEGVESVDSL